MDNLQRGGGLEYAIKIGSLIARRTHNLCTIELLDFSEPMPEPTLELAQLLLGEDVFIDVLGVALELSERKNFKTNDIARLEGRLIRTVRRLAIFSNIQLQVEAGADAQKIAEAIVASLNLESARNLIRANSAHDIQDRQMSIETNVKTGDESPAFEMLDNEKIHSPVIKIVNDGLNIGSTHKLGRGMISLLIMLALFDLILQRAGQITTLIGSSKGGNQ